ncbi:hypothetical protein [Pseudoxanthomonas wuyuanensis]
MRAKLYLMDFFLVAVTGCASTPVPGNVYRGEYFYNFETAAFTPDGSSEPWCVNSAKLKDAEVPANGSPGGPWGTADIVVRGTLSPEGNYCNLGAYKRFLEITEVISISNKRRATP